MPRQFETEGVKVPGKTSVAIFTGVGTPFGGDDGPTRDDITDGRPNTIMCVEAGPDRAAFWTKPEDLPFDKDDPVGSLGNVPGKYFVAVFCDGSARRLRADIDPEVFARMVQHQDGQPVDRDKYSHPGDR